MALSEKFSYLFKFFKRIRNIFQVLCVCLNAFRGYKLWDLTDSHGNSGNLSCCYLLRLLNEPSCWWENVHILDSTRIWRRAISSSRAVDLRAIPTPKKTAQWKIICYHHPAPRRKDTEAWWGPFCYFHTSNRFIVTTETAPTMLFLLKFKSASSTNIPNY